MVWRLNSDVMRKPFKHNQTSSQVCDAPGCRRHLKLNLLDRIPNATKCYNHHMELVRGKANFKGGRRLYTTVRAVTSDFIKNGHH